MKRRTSSRDTHSRRLPCTLYISPLVVRALSLGKVLLLHSVHALLGGPLHTKSIHCAALQPMSRGLQLNLAGQASPKQLSYSPSFQRPGREGVRVSLADPFAVGLGSLPSRRWRRLLARMAGPASSSSSEPKPKHASTFSSQNLWQKKENQRGGLQSTFGSRASQPGPFSKCHSTDLRLPGTSATPSSAPAPLGWRRARAMGCLRCHPVLPARCSGVPVVLHLVVQGLGLVCVQVGDGAVVTAPQGTQPAAGRGMSLSGRQRNALEHMRMGSEWRKADWGGCAQ